jgi:type VI protein secretion system component Hcp
MRGPGPRETDMSFESFIEFNALPGIAGLPQSAPVLSFHWGVSRVLPVAAGRQDLVNVQELSVVKRVDALSPRLFSACLAGAPIAEVILVARQPSGGAEVRYRLGGVAVAAVRPGGSAESGDAFPTEEVSLRFSACGISYAERDGANAVAADWRAGSGPAQAG